MMRLFATFGIFEDISMKEDSLGIVIGSVVACVPVQGTKKLFALTVNIGKRDVTIATALPYYFESGALLGRQLPVKIDVPPVQMHGITSTARLIAIKDKQGMPILLSPDSSVANGDELV